MGIVCHVRYEHCVPSKCWKSTKYFARVCCVHEKYILKTTAKREKRSGRAAAAKKREIQKQLTTGVRRKSHWVKSYNITTKLSSLTISCCTIAPQLYRVQEQHKHKHSEKFVRENRSLVCVSLRLCLPIVKESAEEECVRTVSGLVQSSNERREFSFFKQHISTTRARGPGFGWGAVNRDDEDKIEERARGFTILFLQPFVCCLPHIFLFPRLSLSHSLELLHDLMGKNETTKNGSRN